MRRTSVALLLLGLLGTDGRAQQADFKIIVNASNGVTALTREQVASLFLKKDRQWADESGVSPVDQSLHSLVRSRFSRSVLGHQVSWVKSYWSEQIFTGRGTPPPVRSTDEEVIAFVAEHPGAIGYVAADAALSGGARVLRVVPGV